MRLGYVLIYVPEVAASVAFYEKAFGLSRRFVDDSGQYGEMETGGTALGFVAESLAQTNAVETVLNRRANTPAGAEIALLTEDVASAYERALGAGAIAVAPPKQKPWGQTVAYVRDLDGFLVEICTPVSG